MTKAGRNARKKAEVAKRGARETRKPSEDFSPQLPGVGPGDPPREETAGVTTSTAAQMVPGTHRYYRELEFPERCFKRETYPINHICWNSQGYLGI